MSKQFLTRFRIEGLHGLRTINVEIENNRLILVGENGTGKSTVANLIYFFLTQQWNRILTYKFKYISATIGSMEITLNYQEIMKLVKTRHSPRSVPQRYLRPIRDFAQKQ